jgi:glutathione synthase/RimK-type ligase-like ATP-grasp enzyme
MDRMQNRMQRMQSAAERWGCGSYRTSSGNYAFDEYRAETLRRLEEEQREFMAFLHRLRHAKDKAEFDQFMAEHRRPNGETPQPQAG